MTTTYRIVLEVTDKELNDAQYGSVADLGKILDKVLEQAKLNGYEGDK
jgi:hypothetical protein